MDRLSKVDTDNQVPVLSTSAGLTADAAKDFENLLHPTTLATQDRTPHDNGLQNGGLFTFLVHITAVNTTTKALTAN